MDKPTDLLDHNLDLALVIADLKRMYEDAELQNRSFDHLEDRDVQRWSTLLGITRSCLYDRIALYLARGFQDLELTFQFCDAVVNDLHSMIIFADECRPDLFWEVFLAFDEGEYYHDNNWDEDPVAAYTRPRIAELLSKYASTKE